MNSNTSESTIAAPQSLIPFRDDFGRVIGLEYKKGPDGSVDWRAMIPPEHLFVNKKNLEKKGLPLTDNVAEVGDENLLIKLSGIKHLAKIRGYKSVKYEIFSSDSERCVVKCAIEWLPNFESDSVVYEDVANATIYNTSDFGQKFLETVAANRAFVRAVRNYLNIFIVGSDEVDTSRGAKDLVPAPEEETPLPTPQKLLEKLARNRGLNNFAALKTFLAEKGHDIKCVSLGEAKKIADLAPKDVRVINGLLSEETSNA